MQMTPAGRGRDVSDEEILRAFEEAKDPVLSTAEVAELIGLKRRNTLNRLKSLEEEDAISGKKMGAGMIWWHPESLHESDDRD